MKDQRTWWEIRLSKPPKWWVREKILFEALQWEALIFLRGRKKYLDLTRYITEQL